MIIDSLFRLVAASLRDEGKLPTHVKIRRKDFVKTYPIQQVVNIASRVSGMSRSVGFKDLNNTAGIIRKAAAIMADHRRKHPLGGFASRDVEKRKFDNIEFKVVDLRLRMLNVQGIARERLESVLNNKPNPKLTHHHSYAAIEVVKEADIIVVHSRIESVRLQSYLATRNIKTIVIDNEIAEIYYTHYTRKQRSKMKEKKNEQVSDSSCA